MRIGSLCYSSYVLSDFVVKFLFPETLAFSSPLLLLFFGFK